ncbi:MAG: cysteine peptidase family C39 domain-containing protein, partial [Burkholderiales bacterium]
MLARLHSIAADPSQLAHKFRASNERTGVGELVLAGRSLGLRVKAGRFDPARLATTPLPAIAQDRSGGFFLLAGYQPAASPSGTARVLIHDPLIGRPEILPL